MVWAVLNPRKGWEVHGESSRAEHLPLFPLPKSLISHPPSPTSRSRHFERPWASSLDLSHWFTTAGGQAGQGPCWQLWFPCWGPLYALPLAWVSWSMILVQHLRVLKVHPVLTLRNTFWTRKHGSQDGEAACPRVSHRGRLGQMDAVCPGPLDLLHFMQHRRRHPGFCSVPSAIRITTTLLSNASSWSACQTQAQTSRGSGEGGPSSWWKLLSVLGSWNPWESLQSLA